MSLMNDITQTRMTIPYVQSCLQIDY